MKKIILVLFLLGSSLLTQAQSIDTLSTNPEIFVKDLKNLFDATKKENLKDLAKTFEKQVNNGEFSDILLQNLISTTNQMLKMKGKAFPQLQELLETYIEINQLSLEEERIKNWQEVLMQVMLNSKKGDTKTTLSFLEFSVPLLEKNALYDSKAKSWYLSSDIFSLSYDEERGPVVSAPKTDIIGTTPNDTLYIYNSGGKYYSFETTWEASHGEVDWTKAGLDKSEVYCVFDNHSIDMSTQNYIVDSVFFVYEGYFDKPINGQLEDKLMTNNTSFPKFSAGRSKVPPQQITENVIYEGGFTLAGSKIIGKAGFEKATLTIYKPNSKVKLLKAIADFTTIDRINKVTASDAEIALYFDGDSIYHPSVNLTYTIADNTVKLVKGESSLAKSKFIDSYHNVDFDADVITWILDNDFIDINTVSTSGIKPAFYESKEFFSTSRMKKIRGNVSYDPLSILNKYAETNQTNEIYAYVYAELISSTLTVKQLKPLIFKLIQEGFITYDDQTDIITIREKVNHYVRSQAKFKDYDNISIESTTKNQNGRIDLSSKDIHVEGVSNVPISYATMTEFFPDSGRIAIKKDRDMVFDGMFFCGRVDIFGRENYFQYDSFNMTLPYVDTLILNVPDGDLTDASGNPILRPINTVLEELIGDININIPINKSGRADLAQFPILTSNEKSRIYFDNDYIRNGTYSRSHFYYELDPFIIDSLSHINVKNILFDGVLFSAGIFPEIREPLRVQPDFTLGFHLQSPEEGFELYRGKGKFVSDITLNGKGLTGEGKVEYMTTSFEANDIAFYPDSLLCTANVLNMEESRGTYESPKASSINNPVSWTPYKDTMLIDGNPEQPFTMYDDKITMDGNLIVTNNRVAGNGVADWDDAQLSSDYFHFKGQEILADTAALEIKSIEGDKVTFNTPNVNAHVDFEKNTGFFKSNLQDNQTEFNYNQYVTGIDEFFWDITNKVLEFSVPEGNTEGAPFASIHPDQDSLTFKAISADYSLVSSIIEAHGVSEILVADSRIIPENGEVVIHPHADMQVLNNAVIEADAVSKKHRIENVTADIDGKNKILASGEYLFQPKDGELQRIDLTEITAILADSSMINKKKKNQTPPEYILYGKGDVSQREQLVVYPNVTFYGDIEFISSLDYPRMDGYIRIDFQNDYVATDYMNVKTEIDPMSLRMDVSEAKGPSEQLIKTGIFVSRLGMDPLYTNILNTNIAPGDVALLDASGLLEHRYDENQYAFGDEEKLDNPDQIMKGNILIFNPEDNDIYGEGSLDLGLNLGGIADKTAGNVITNLESNEYALNTTIALNIDLDKTILEKIGYYWYEDNFDQEEINYDNEDLQRHFAEFVEAKTLSKMQEDIATTGFFSKPKEIKESLVFTDINLIYNPIRRTYTSEGKIGIAFIGDKGVHKKIEGWIDMGHRIGDNTLDYFDIYLKTGLGDWLYMTYNGKNLEIVSSYDEINNAIKAVDGNKRVVKGENGLQYIYSLSTEYKMKLFLQKMKNGGEIPNDGGPQIINFGEEDDEGGTQIINFEDDESEIINFEDNNEPVIYEDSPFSSPSAPEEDDEDENVEETEEEN